MRNGWRWRTTKIRRALLGALGEIGPKAKAAAAALTRLTENEDGSIRVAAHFALAKIDPKSTAAAVSALAELSEKEDCEIRWRAAMALGMIGPKAKKAIPVLTELLLDPDRQVRETAAEALKEINKDKK